MKLLEAASGALATARRLWKLVRQLRGQKVELLRETGSVLAQLGRIDPLVGYASIGDHGKMVLDYQRSLGVQGKVWVVHDVNADGRTAAATSERDANEDRSRRRSLLRSSASSAGSHRTLAPPALART